VKGGEKMVSIRDNLTLKACRIIANIKAEEIAAEIGVTVDTIYKWEKAKTSPNAIQLKKIINCFAKHGYIVTLDDLKFF
jgi:DNA-binding XRE family transcriptional regulator